MSRDTRTRLLDTAERLFAARGIEATSVRDIIKDAGANLGAITYHFGSKETLITSVIERRMLPLNEERARLLDAAERDAPGGVPSLEVVLRAVMAPTIRLWRSNPGFMRMFGRMHAEPNLKLQKCAEAKPFFRRVMGAVARAVPDLPPEEIAWRMLFLRGSMVHTWTGASRLATVTGLNPLEDDDESIIDRLIQFGAAGLRAPSVTPAPTTPRAESRRDRPHQHATTSQRAVRRRLGRAAP